jgi:ornithine--oxo-acid transaminase
MRESDLAWDICMKFRDYGLLAKPTHGNKMTHHSNTESHDCLAIIERALNDLNDYFKMEKFIIKEQI